MQILPSTRTRTSGAFQSANGLSTYEDSTRSSAFADFLSLYSGLSRKEKTSRSEETRTQDPSLLTPDPQAQADLAATLEETQVREPLTQATRENNPADLSPSQVSSVPTQVNLSLQDMKMSRDDLDSMRAGLKNYGLSSSDLSEIESKVASTEGLTWGQFVRTLSEKMRSSKKGTQLATSDVQELQSFFQKVGFTPGEAQTQIKSLAQGNAGNVLAAVQSRLDSQAQDRSLAVTSRELTTFLSATSRAARGVGSSLTKAAAEKLQNAAGKVSSQLTALAEQVAAAGSSAQGVRQLLTQLKGELAQQTQSQAQKDQSLVKLVGDSLEKAAQRDTLWNKTDREAQNSKAMLQAERGVSKDIKNFSQQLRSQSNNAQQVEQAMAATRQSQNAMAEQSSRQLQAKDAKTSETGQDELFSAFKNARQGAKLESAAAARFGEQAEAKAKTGQDAQEDSTWKEFFSKLNTSGQTTDALRTNSTKTQDFVVFDTQRNASVNLNTSVNTAANANVNSATARQVLAQVQNGAFSNLGQGKTQLTLQLQPENMGNLSVLLQVKNKEVQAVIRADSQETGKLLAANLESLRQSLEEQGLKVARLEVQTGLTGNQDQSAWLGQDGHNLAREQQEAMAGMKMRWRIMSQEDGGLAQGTLSVEEQAALTDQGLHLIA